MLILTIETCTDMSTLGLVRDGAVLAEAAFPSRHTLARRLLARTEWLLAECGLGKGDLEAIALSRGPGSFTGVRIGAAAAKTLAWGLQVPLAAVSTLEALAYPFRDLQDVLLAPIINARRQQVYTALFSGGEGGLRRRTDDLLLSADPFRAELAAHAGGFRQVLLTGLVEGLPEAFRSELPLPAATVHATVPPRALALLAAERLARGEADDPMTLTPEYLRGVTD
jgi:tRNA threonylcarbamoyladenosine biosynthesis protein TsaB